MYFGKLVRGPLKRIQIEPCHFIKWVFQSKVARSLLIIQVLRENVLFIELLGCWVINIPGCSKTVFGEYS